MEIGLSDGGNDQDNRASGIALLERQITLD